MIRLASVLLFTLAGGPFFPWWWPAIPGILAGFWKPDRPVRSFWTAALGAGLAWAGVAAWLDARNEGVLAARIAPMFFLPGAPGLILAAAAVAGVTAGLGASFGGMFRLFWRSLGDALAAEDVVVPPDEGA